jgi:hypothetical protein
MAEERTDIENIDRKDPSEYTISEDDASREDMLDLKTSDESYDLSDDDTPAEAEQIKDQIEETRSQMGETIDAIQDKLSFSNLSDQVSEHVSNAVETAKVAVYDATIGKAANMMKNLSNDLSNSTVIRTAKNNPLPFILIGVGAGILAYQGYTGKLSYTRDRRRYLRGPREQDMPSQSSTTGTTSETLSGVKEAVSATASNALNKVSGAVDTAYSSAGEMANKAYDKAGRVRYGCAGYVRPVYRGKSLAVGAVALGLGAAIGLALPSTQYEGQMLGEAREQFLEKAQDTASHLLDKTKQVVSEANRNLTQQNAGLTEH